MSKSLVRQMIHCIFSTKNREPWITNNLEPSVYKYIVGIVNKTESKVLSIGGIENHVHILISLSPKISTSRMLQLLKGGSSFLVTKNNSEMSHFSWQSGYSAFSIGVSQIARTKKYIENQKVHHRTVSFVDELKEILNKHGIELKDEDLD